MRYTYLFNHKVAHLLAQTIYEYVFRLVSLFLSFHYWEKDMIKESNMHTHLRTSPILFSPRTAITHVISHTFPLLYVSLLLFSNFLCSLYFQILISRACHYLDLPLSLSLIFEKWLCTCRGPRRIDRW